MSFKMKGFPMAYSSSPMKQEKPPMYWFKINGKSVTQKEYCAYENKPGGDTGGKTTNHPDACGIKAKHKKKN